MPCVDAPNAACPHDIRITVAETRLLWLLGSCSGRHGLRWGRKTFHFSLPHATVAAHVAFAAGTPPLCSFCMSPAIACSDIHADRDFLLWNEDGVSLDVA